MAKTGMEADALTKVVAVAGAEASGWISTKPTVRVFAQ
jgi:hypothetical protein